MSIFDDEPDFSDRTEPTARSSKIPVLLGVGLALAIILGLVVFYDRAEPDESEPEVAAVETERPPPRAAPTPEPTRDILDAPTTGTLRIVSSIPHGDVFIDDELRGQLPLEIKDLDARLYRIRVESQGYENYVSIVTVRAGREIELGIPMLRTPPSLVVNSDVAGATVFVDRTYKGTTPLTIENLTPGEHQVTVSADGHDMYAEKIELGDGRRELNVQFKNQAVSESTPVVHKHRMGSCEGRLVANGAGLNYETNHKDAFSVTFSELEIFEVDYIENNLKVKPRGQRNYNFTDPSGDSDPLFVFHQKVTAFRQRSGDGN